MGPKASRWQATAKTLRARPTGARQRPAIGSPDQREGSRMRRRDFIAGLAASAWPVVVRAQRSAMAVVGFLSAQSADLDYKDTTIPFLQGLKEVGYVDGQNVVVEYCYAENQLDRLPALAADLVRRRAAEIVASAITVARAAKAATTTIPIVFLAGGDPVAMGLVASLDRPGANLTGIALLEGETVAKRLQLLRELIPNAARFGVLADPASVNTQSAIADLQAAAPTLGLQLVVVNASTDRDFEPAFASFSQQRVGAILVGGHVTSPPLRCFVSSCGIMSPGIWEALIPFPYQYDLAM
jgi:putative tryptophan/tyrosine transport system substrate-binding protein